MTRQPLSILEQTTEAFAAIIEREGLRNADVSVEVVPLTPEEAIGRPWRRDFPIIVGKERVIEATVLGSRGQAFTDSPQDFEGTLADALDLDLTSNRGRAVYTASLNAVLGHVGMVQGTVHCRDEDPERCAWEIADYLGNRFGAVSVGLIGLNPAIAERLVDRFGPDRVRITDLDRDNVGLLRFGVEIWDGAKRTRDLIDASDVVLFTGTTVVNGTFDQIWDLIQSMGKHYVVYGMTAAGVCRLTGLSRICPYAR
jgi:hypothetical protein